MSSYAKAATAVLGAVLVAVASAMTDGELTDPERIQVAIAAFTAFSVFLTANTLVPGWKYAKSITAGVLAGLSLLGGYFAGGQDMTDALWLNVAIAALTAAGVFAVPNRESIDLREG